MRGIIQRGAAGRLMGLAGIAMVALAGTSAAWGRQEPRAPQVSSPNARSKEPTAWTLASAEAACATAISDALFGLVLELVPEGRRVDDRPDEWKSEVSMAWSSAPGLPAWVTGEAEPLIKVLRRHQAATEEETRVSWLSRVLADVDAMETSVAATESARRVAGTAVRLAIARRSGDPAKLAAARAEAVERLEAVFELEVGEQPARQCPLGVRQAAELVLLREGLLTGPNLSAALLRMNTARFLMISKVAKGLDAYERAATDEARREAASAGAADVCEGLARADLAPGRRERVEWVINGLDRLSGKVEPGDFSLSMKAVRIMRAQRASTVVETQPRGEGETSSWPWEQVLQDPGFAGLPIDLRWEFAVEASNDIRREVREGRQKISDPNRQVLYERLTESMDGGARDDQGRSLGPVMELIGSELGGEVELLDRPRAALVGRLIDGMARGVSERESRMVVLLRVWLELRSGEPSAAAWSAALDGLAVPAGPGVKMPENGRKPVVAALQLATDRAAADGAAATPSPGLVERARLLVRTAEILSPQDQEMAVDVWRGLAVAAMRSARERAGLGGWAGEFDGLIEAVKVRAAALPWVEPLDAEQLERARWAQRLREAGQGDEARKMALEVINARTEPGKGLVGRAAFWLAWAEVLESVSAAAGGAGGGEGDVRIRLRALAAVDAKFGRLDDSEKATLPGAPSQRVPTSDERDAMATLTDAADRLAKLSERVEKAK